MYYVLMRTCIINKTTYFPLLIFDLWNEKYDTGYEVHITINARQKKSACLLANDYRGKIYDISDWDKIFREIKECI